MWQKLLIATILFCLFALLQNSFFTHFDLFGAAPNLVFALFFLLVFFLKKDNNYQILFFAIIAGTFLDIFSFTYLGPSIIFLLLTGFLLKKIQELLKNKEDGYPFVHFFPLFVVFLLVYNLLMDLYLYFLDPNKIAPVFSIEIIFSIIYNLAVASLFFYLYKKFLQTSIDDRQLKLFSKL